MSEKIIKVDYKDEMEKAYIDYSMSVITSRALPDIRDGLKPVHRRILYAMKQLNLEPNGSFKKSARVVGDVLGKYHPHGDTSVYEAMVRLSQDFNMSMPLVNGHGNFGSIDGDGAAAMRYTEAKLQPLSKELLSGLDEGLIDYTENFDNSLKEPSVLPANFPNLLVNGSMGIAVGMSTSIPPHNINEVIRATLRLIDSPNLSVKQIMRSIKGPDFPTGGIISNKKELSDIYSSGSGKIKIRAKLKIEKMDYGKKAVIITEIPYTLSGNKTKLIEDIAKMIIDKKLSEATDIRDESSKEGMRVVIEVKKGTNIENFKNKLFKLTKLEDTFSVNLLALSKNKPVVFNLKEMLEEYIEFLKEINNRKIDFVLDKDINRLEILNGLIKATDVIDLIIEIIRNSKDIATVKKCLVKGVTKGIKFKTKKSEKHAKKLLFTEKQANAILSMQLQRLVGLEIKKLEEEKNEKEKNIKYYKSLKKNKKKFNEFIKKDLERINNEYNVKRRTELDDLKIKEIKKEAKEEDVYALIDKYNYIKIIDSQSYSRTTEENLKNFTVIPATNLENIGIFDDDGDFHTIKIPDLPLSKSTDKGEPIENLVNKNKINILKIINFSKACKDNKVLFVTKLGLVKRVQLSEYESNRTTLIATKINKKDKLINVELLDEKDVEMYLETKEGRFIRFMVEEISVQKRNAKGVRGINLNIGDEVNKSSLSRKTKERKRRRGAKGKIK